MERTNDLIPKIIELHKKREGLNDGEMTQREANLIVCCLEQFDVFLERRQNIETGERQLTIPDVSLSVCKQCDGTGYLRQIHARCFKCKGTGQTGS
jgi:hypothetical protein